MLCARISGIRNTRRYLDDDVDGKRSGVLLGAIAVTGLDVEFRQEEESRRGDQRDGASGIHEHADWE